MPGGLCRVIAALALVIFATAAVAQPVIPPSAQPGRERERFTEPPAPLASRPRSRRGCRHRSAAGRRRGRLLRTGRLG